MVKIQDVQNNYSAFIQEITKGLQGKRRGYLKSIPVGKRIFPFAIPPRLEILLLDPDDLTIQFRRVSDPVSPERRKGKWQTGKPVDAVACVIEWADTMKKVANQGGKGIEQMGRTCASNVFQAAMA